MNKLVMLSIVGLTAISMSMSGEAAAIEVIDKDSSIAVNQPPVLDSIGNKSTREEEQLTFTIKASDREGVPVLSVENLPEGAAFSDYGDGTGVFDWKPDWTPTSDNTGNFIITFYATDDSGAVAYEEITIWVNQAESHGLDAAIMLGFSAPQGTFSRYADGGFTAGIRVSYHPKPLPAIGVWADFNYTWFGSDYSTIKYNEPFYEPYAEQKITEESFCMHLGAQIGSKSRRAFFRPRAGVGPGLYLFTVTNTITATEWPSGEEEEFSGIEESYVRFGWRFFIGTDLYIKARYGIALDLVYDHVYKLDHPEGLYAPRLTTRFNGFSAGVTISY